MRHLQMASYWPCKAIRLAPFFSTRCLEAPKWDAFNLPNDGSGFAPVMYHFSPDGQRLAVYGHAKQEKSACVWIYDIPGLWPLVRLAEKSDHVNLGVFAPDGKTLALVSGDWSNAHLRLWDTESGKILHDLGEHGAAYRGGTVFSPDGKLLAARVPVGDNWDITGENKLRLWDTASGKELPAISLEARAGPVLFTPNSRVFAVGNGRIIRLHDSTSGKIMHEFEADRGTSFSGDGDRDSYHAQQGLGWPYAFSPDGKVFAAAQASTVRRWDIATGQEIDPPVSRTPIYGLAISTDGRTVAAGGTTQVTLWDVTAAKHLHTLHLDVPVDKEQPQFDRPRIRNVAFSPNGKQVAVSGKGQVGVWETDGKQLWQQSKHQCKVSVVAFADDGSAVVTAGPGSHVIWSDITTGRELRSVPDKDSGSSTLSGQVRYDWPWPAFALKGDRLLAELSKDLCIWELTSGKQRSTFPTEKASQGGWLALSPDGRLLAIPRDYCIQLFDTLTGKEVRSFGGLFQSSDMAFTPDGRLLAASSCEHVYLWEVATGILLTRFRGHRGDILTLAFSGDGRTLATGGYDSIILLWDMPTLLKPPVRAELSAKDLAELWDQLAAEDAVKAREAMGAFPRMRRRRPLCSAIGSSPRPLIDISNQLIADLDSDTYQVRHRAEEELAKLDTVAEESLRKALAGKPSAELEAAGGSPAKKTGQPDYAPRAGPGPTRN